jgi:hypothetical protein
MPRKAIGSGSGQSDGAFGNRPIRSRAHAADTEGRPHDAMDQGNPRIWWPGDAGRIEQQLRQWDALFHRDQALLVDNFQPPPALDVLEIQLRHKGPGQRCDDEAVSKRMSHVASPCSSDKVSRSTVAEARPPGRRPALGDTIAG